MNNSKKVKDSQTKIVFSDLIDTPYPYCVIPKNSLSISDSVQISQTIQQPPRSLLTVTTWDGRPLYDLRSVDK